MSVAAIQVPQNLVPVLTRAGDRSGVDFNYLVKTAFRESSFSSDARASSSSAVGLFQFLESTWLEVMKQDGGRLGYGNYARAIEQDSDGNYVIRDNALRGEVLSLREDPQVAADLAAAYTRRNGEYLANRFGRPPSPGELYIAHFLGARGAERLFVAGLENPDQAAAPLFRQQAAANPAIFFDGGRPRTIREVYRALIADFGGGGNGGAVVQGAVPVAGAENELVPVPPGPGERIPSRIGPGVRIQAPDVSFTSMFSDAASTGTPVQNSVIVDPGGALFVQLYGR